jgi:hypothetical protein
MVTTVRGLLKLTIYVGIAILIYVHNFYYLDFENDCYIELESGLMSLLEFNHGNIKESLSALRYGAPDQYKIVCESIDVIKSDLGCGGWGGGCHYRESGSITLSTTNSSFIGWTAGVITHETCHDRQVKEERDMSQDECYAVDHATMQELVEIYP